MNIDKSTELLAALEEMKPDAVEREGMDTVRDRTYPFECAGVFASYADEQEYVEPLAGLTDALGQSIVEKRGLNADQMKATLKSSNAGEVIRDDEDRIVVIFAKEHTDIRLLAKGDDNLRQNNPDLGAKRCEPCQKLALRARVTGRGKSNTSQIVDAVKQYNRTKDLLDRRGPEDEGGDGTLNEATVLTLKGHLGTASETIDKILETDGALRDKVAHLIPELAGSPTDEDEG